MKNGNIAFYRDQLISEIKWQKSRRGNLFGRHKDFNVLVFKRKIKGFGYAVNGMFGSTVYDSLEEAKAAVIEDIQISFYPDEYEYLTATE